MVHSEYSTIKVLKIIMYEKNYYFSGKPPRPREYTGPYIRVELEYEVKKVERPIGITILVNGNVVVGDRGKNLVVMFDQRGRKIKTIEPGKRFKRPSDMTTLSDGRFAVRDDLGLQVCLIRVNQKYSMYLFE